MVVMKAQSSTHENIRGSEGPNFITEMCAAMDELPRQNLTSKENILNIQQRQQEVTPHPPPQREYGSVGSLDIVIQDIWGMYSWRFQVSLGKIW